MRPAVLQGGRSPGTELRPSSVRLIAADPTQIISVGYDRLRGPPAYRMEGPTAELCRILRRTGAQQIVDVRPGSYLGDTDARRAFFYHLLALHVDYQHLPELGNPYAAEADAAMVFGRYGIYLSNQTTGLRLFRAAVKKGPTVLIGTARRHRASERAILLDVLQTQHTLRIID